MDAVIEEQGNQEEKQIEQQDSEASVMENEEGNDGGQDEEGVVVTIGGAPVEEEQAKAPEWVKELRQQQKELKKRNRELEEELNKHRQPAQAELRPKPTLEGCAYDEEAYEADLVKWYEEKRTIDTKKEELRRAAEEQEKTWKEKLDAYGKAKAELKVTDYDDAEDSVQSALSKEQQGIIVHAAKNPSLMVYALGKNPAKLKEVAGIKDPLLFAVAIGELSKEIVMKPRNKPPAPTPKVSGSGSLSGATDGTLDRLRAEAEKSGDYTKVHQYRQQLRIKQKS